MKDEKEFVTIKCPKCGTEYLPAEIFVPSAYFGKPKDILRTVEGKIDYFSGKSLDTSERYVCDRCLTPFIVKSTVTFSSEADPKANFNEEYSTIVRPRKLNLFEG